MTKAWLTTKFVRVALLVGVGVGVGVGDGDGDGLGEGVGLGAGVPGTTGTGADRPVDEPLQPAVKVNIQTAPNSFDFTLILPRLTKRPLHRVGQLRQIPSHERSAQKM